MKLFTNVYSPESMINAIQEIGIIPFSKNCVAGWSIQEITDPDFWFTTSDQLGPWDWKVDAVQEGIIYGKFISRKSAFATIEFYRHLMNWRRSLPKYRIPVGEKLNPSTLDDRLMIHLSPTCLTQYEKEKPSIRQRSEDCLKN